MGSRGAAYHLVLYETFKLLHRAIDDVEILLKWIWEGVVSVVLWVGHWLWVLAMCCWLWFLWRRAREARALMNEALAGCEPPPAEESGNSHLMVSTNIVSATLDKYLGHDLRDKWLEAARGLGYKLRQIGADKRGLSVIAFYAATHGLFAVLLVRLLLNW